MKWFKHDSMAHNDEKIRELIHENGVESYGIYIICLELIAEKVDADSSPEIEITWRVLSEKCRTRRDKVAKNLKTIHDLGLIVCDFKKDKVKLCCHNLLKRLDNWTKNSQVTCKQLSAKQKQKENKKEKENKSREKSAVFNDNEKSLIAKDYSTTHNISPDSESAAIRIHEITQEVSNKLGVKNPIGLARAIARQA